MVYTQGLFYEISQVEVIFNIHFKVSELALNKRLHWPMFKNFFQRLKVFQLICIFFGALNPKIRSIFFGQVKFLRYD